MIIPVGGRIIDFKFYNTVGGTWTRPERCTSVIVIGIGGGGGGGRLGGAGSSGTSTSFGGALICGGGSGGPSSRVDAGANGTVTGSNVIIQNLASARTFFNLFGHGQGGLGTNRFCHGDSGGGTNFYTTSTFVSNMGGAGGFGVAYIKTNLLDSYAVSIGAGGGGGGDGAETGRNGALLVIELGD
jgi:hypothetical protein